MALRFDYTTVLNIVFLLVGAVLVIRFVRTGGRPMLKMMGGNPSEDHAPGHPPTEPTGTSPEIPTTP
jgi:hypothetical protein